jgi:tetratricopeptide (TPR) repeat protein
MRCSEFPLHRFQTAARAARRASTGRAAALGAVALLLAGSPVASASPGPSIKAKQAQSAVERADEPRLVNLGDYLQGRIAQLDHDWRIAGPAMYKAWQADRGDVQLRHDALLLSVASGDFAAATDIAHTVQPDSPDAGLANFVMTIGDLADARYAGVDAKVASGRGLDVYLKPLLAAWAEAGRGRKDAALAALAPLDAMDGAAELRAIQGAMIAEMLGDAAKAGAFYGKVLEGKPSVRALTAAADFYQRQGDDAAARAAAERLDPDGSSSSVRIELLARVGDKRKASAAPTVRSGAAEALFNLAASLSADERQTDIAPLLYVQLALHLAPDFPAAQLLLAELDQRWGKWAESADILLGVDSKTVIASTAARLAMGALNKAGDADKALATGRAAVAAHPEDIDLVLSYADLLRMKSHYAEAIAGYDAALKEIPPASNRRGVALYHRGIAYQQAHEWPRAETDLLAALQLRPEDPGLLNYLAFSWADQGINLDRARTMLERAVELVPDDGAIVDSLGWVMYRAGDYPEAVKQLEHAVSLDADDATINDHLGDAYWRSGRQIEARSQWERAERLSDDKALTEQIRAKLRDGLDSAAPRRAAAD